MSIGVAILPVPDKNSLFVGLNGRGSLKLNGIVRLTAPTAASTSKRTIQSLKVYFEGITRTFVQDYVDEEILCSSSSQIALFHPKGVGGMNIPARPAEDDEPVGVKGECDYEFEIDLQQNLAPSCYIDSDSNKLTSQSALSFKRTERYSGETYYRLVVRFQENVLHKGVFNSHNREETFLMAPMTMWDTQTLIDLRHPRPYRWWSVDNLPGTFPQVLDFQVEMDRQIVGPEDNLLFSFCIAPKVEGVLVLKVSFCLVEKFIIAAHYKTKRVVVKDEKKIIDWTAGGDIFGDYRMKQTHQLRIPPAPQVNPTGIWGKQEIVEISHYASATIRFIRVNDIRFLDNRLMMSKAATLEGKLKDINIPTFDAKLPEISIRVTSVNQAAAERVLGPSPFSPLYQQQSPLPQATLNSTFFPTSPSSTSPVFFQNQQQLQLQQLQHLQQHMLQSHSPPPNSAMGGLTPMSPLSPLSANSYHHPNLSVKPSYAAHEKKISDNIGGLKSSSASVKSDPLQANRSKLSGEINVDDVRSAILKRRASNSSKVERWLQQVDSPSEQKNSIISIDTSKSAISSPSLTYVETNSQQPNSPSRRYTSASQEADQFSRAGEPTQGASKPDHYSRRPSDPAAPLLLRRQSNAHDHSMLRPPVQGMSHPSVGHERASASTLASSQTNFSSQDNTRINSYSDEVIATNNEEKEELPKFDSEFLNPAVSRARKSFSQASNVSSIQDPAVLVEGIRLMTTLGRSMSGKKLLNDTNNIPQDVLGLLDQLPSHDAGNGERSPLKRVPSLPNIKTNSETVYEAAPELDSRGYESDITKIKSGKSAIDIKLKASRLRQFLQNSSAQLAQHFPQSSQQQHSIDTTSVPNPYKPPLRSAPVQSTYANLHRSNSDQSNGSDRQPRTPTPGSIKTGMSQQLNRSNSDRSANENEIAIKTTTTATTTSNTPSSTANSLVTIANLSHGSPLPSHLIPRRSHSGSRKPSPLFIIPSTSTTNSGENSDDPSSPVRPLRMRQRALSESGGTLRHFSNKPAQEITSRPIPQRKASKSSNTQDQLRELLNLPPDHLKQKVTAAMMNGSFPNSNYLNALSDEVRISRVESTYADANPESVATGSILVIDDNDIVSDYFVGAGMDAIKNHR